MTNQTTIQNNGLDVLKFLKNSPFMAVLVTAAFSGSLEAATLSWGGAFFTQNYSADGTALESGASNANPTGDVLFELGVFQNDDGSEFVPSYGNVSEWNAKWVQLTANNGSVVEATSAYSSPQNYYGNSVSLGDLNEQVTTTGAAFSGGDAIDGFRTYVWGYDSKTLDATTQPEWFLVTGDDGGSESSDTNWLLPDSSASTNGSFALTWDMASANTAVVGRIDDGSGGGEMTDPGTPLGESDYQFAVVPEPSSLMLIALCGFATLRRRRSP